jgi:hypothetical protein
MADPSTTRDCTDISVNCPVEATIYGYYPGLGANAFFCAFFGVFLLANFILGFRYKTWVFSSIVAIGCFTEALGYVGRIIMNNNPWSSIGFQIQICTLIIAPVSDLPDPTENQWLTKTSLSSPPLSTSP